MIPETAEIVIKDRVKGMRKRLEQAAHMVKAAHACAVAGSPEKGIEIILNLGQNLREANKLLEGTLAASHISKLALGTSGMISP
jgi:hypothetical protein